MEAPYNIINHRREQCEHCPTPCEYQNDVAFRTEGSNACPKGRFMACETFMRVSRVPKRFRGLGDVVESVAGPVAKVIDGVLKTNVSGCGACRKRQEMLNELVPFNNSGGM